MRCFRLLLSVISLLALAAVGCHKEAPAPTQPSIVTKQQQNDYPDDPYYAIRFDQTAKAKAAKNAADSLAKDDQEAFAYFGTRKWRAYSDAGTSPDKPNLFLYVEDSRNPYDFLDITVDDCRQIAKFKSIRGLIISRSPESLNDECIQAIASLPNLEVLDINGDKLTDAALQAIAASTSIERLRIYGKALGDEGIRALGKMPKLKSLLIANAPISGVGFTSFAGNQLLESLTLEDCGKLTDAGAAALVELGGLKELFLEKSPGKMTKAGLVSLTSKRVPAHFSFAKSLLSDRALQQLVAHGWLYRPAEEQVANFKIPTSVGEVKAIELSDADIGDDGFAALEPCTNIQRLVLNNTKVTDGIAPKLKSFPNLAQLALNGTKVGDETLERVSS